MSRPTPSVPTLTPMPTRSPAWAGIPDAMIDAATNARTRSFILPPRGMNQCCGEWRGLWAGPGHLSIVRGGRARRLRARAPANAASRPAGPGRPRRFHESRHRRAVRRARDGVDVPDRVLRLGHFLLAALKRLALRGVDLRRDPRLGFLERGAVRLAA